jgi:hypothetical protein
MRNAMMVLGTISFRFFLTILKYDVIKFLIILISIADLGECGPEVSYVCPLNELGMLGSCTGLMLV